MDEMNVTSAKYVVDADGNNTSIQCTIDGAIWCILMRDSNPRYQAVLRWVAEGNTIADAD
jgi:hypothetical protein